MPSPSEPRPVRVCTIPGRHGYVDRCLAGAAGVRHLPDTAGSTSPSDPWQPSPALRPDWVQTHAEGIDVVHLHFGFEHRTPEQLVHWVEALDRQHVGLVLTVHDLDNPHVVDQHAHHRSLGVLTRAASEVITLTEGAAAVIRQRYGVQAQVIAHPHQFDLDLVGRRTRSRSPRAGRIGLNLRSLRANVDAPAALALLANAPATAQVVVRISAAELDATGTGSLGDLVRNGERAGRWEVDVVAGYCAERDLWRFLSGLDALLLPYRWGTHSGWVESCWDVGTTVIAPPVGYYSQQRPVTELPLNSDAATVRHVLGDLQPSGIASPQERRSEQSDVAAEHSRLYRRAAR